MDLNELREGVFVEMKKAHPCGGRVWKIVRSGADKKLQCTTCGRNILLLPDELVKRVKRIIKENG